MAETLADRIKDEQPLFVYGTLLADIFPAEPVRHMELTEDMGYIPEGTAVYPATLQGRLFLQPSQYSKGHPYIAKDLSDATKVNSYTIIGAVLVLPEGMRDYAFEIYDYHEERFDFRRDGCLVTLSDNSILNANAYYLESVDPYHVELVFHDKSYPDKKVGSWLRYVNEERFIPRRELVAEEE